MLELEAVPIAEFHMGLSTALYRRSLLSIDSVDLLPSSQCICFAVWLSCFLLILMFFAHTLTQNFKTQNYCFWGALPSSGILEARKHDVSETGSVSVFR
jgi:hypothetical protein